MTTVQAEVGLSDSDASQRIGQYGYNEIEEKEEPLWQRLFRRFWGPIPWTIEIAALLSAVVQKWEDFSIILVMLLVNAGLDFFQEHRALNAFNAFNAFNDAVKVATYRFLRTRGANI